MKKIVLSSALAATSLLASAQVQEWCSSVPEHNRLMQDPDARAEREAFEEAVMRFINDPNANLPREGEKLIIPVVFHVLHKGGAENITKAQCEDQVRVLNTDFNRTMADTVHTPHRFRATEEAWFTFTSDDPSSYAGAQRYIKLTTPQGAIFSFWFNDGVSTTAPSSAPGTKIAVNIASATSKNDVATAFSTAVNARPEFVTRTDTDNDNPRIKVVGERPGNAEDFASNNLTASVIDSVHRQGSLLAGKANIEFRLATKDPLGNCTDGIVRVYSSKTNRASNASGFKAVSYWNAYSYLNIWVIADINSDDNEFGTILGYAQFPATGFLSTDGIAIRSDNIGSIGTGSAGGRVGRTVVHEVGHWLNLIHIWGDAECGSDQVSDTPTAQAPNFGVCGNASGSGTANHWTPYKLGVCDPQNPDGEMFNNYMDYSDDACMNMFTAGQVARMRFTLTGQTGSDGIRGFMVSQQNLEATGTADPYTASNCAPISDFYFSTTATAPFQSTKMVCAGSNISFKQNVFNASADSYSWTFEGGNPGTSTVANPNNINYPNPGRFDVSLTATNTVGSNTATKNDYVIVSPTTAQNQSDWGYVEAFWHEDQFNSDFHVFNFDNTANKWEYFVAPYSTPSGNECLRMNNIDNTTDEYDEIVTPSYNLSTITSPKLSFMYSGAAIDNSPDDKLRVYLSKDCGETWSNISTAGLTGFALCNSGLYSSAYVPNAQSVWTKVEAAIPSTMASASNVRVKFQFLSGGRSNNFYIDNITLSNSITGMDDIAQMIGLNISPNPASSTVRISMNLVDNTALNMSLVDMTGRTVRSIHNGTMASGGYNFDVDLNGLDNGIYFVRMAIDNDVVTRKLVVAN